MANNVHFTSTRQDWKTPKAVYEALNDEFSFDFDPCPPDPKFDGLSIEWGRRNFVNPPYKDLKRWCEKAYKEHGKGKLIVMLIPSRTDTAAWHDYIMRADEIRFIRGRLKFDDQKNSAPFPSAIVVFRGKQMNKPWHEQQAEDRAFTEQISRLEDEADRLRALGRLTPEREELILQRMARVTEEYERNNWSADKISEREG